MCGSVGLCVCVCVCVCLQVYFCVCVLSVRLGCVCACLCLWVHARMGALLRNMYASERENIMHSICLLTKYIMQISG